jgi:hypothetical protein
MALMIVKYTFNNKCEQLHANVSTFVFDKNYFWVDMAFISPMNFPYLCTKWKKLKSIHVLTSKMQETATKELFVHIILLRYEDDTTCLIKCQYWKNPNIYDIEFTINTVDRIYDICQYKRQNYEHIESIGGSDQGAFWYPKKPIIVEIDEHLSGVSMENELYWNVQQHHFQMRMMINPREFWSEYEYQLLQSFHRCQEMLIANNPANLPLPPNIMRLIGKYLMMFGKINDERPD